MALLLLLMLLLIAGLADVRTGTSARPLKTPRTGPRMAPQRWPPGLDVEATTRQALPSEARSAKPTVANTIADTHAHPCAEFRGDLALLLERATPLRDDGAGPDHHAQGEVARIWLFPDGAWRLIPGQDLRERPGAAQP